MHNVKTYRYITLLAAVLIWIPSVGQAAPGHTGTVVETITAKRYTYVRVTNDTGSAWIVGPKLDIEVGQAITTERGMPMRDFVSESLDRQFDLIYFVSSLEPVTDSTGLDNLPAGHPPLEKAPATDPPDLDLSDIETPAEGITIAQLHARKDSLAGQRVTLRGKVSKFLPRIMDRNWIHLRDGSTTETDAHIVVTTGMELQRGDLVTVSGTLALNRDFGSGYTYAVIVEDADVVIEGLQFPPSRLATVSGEMIAKDSLYESEDCSECHEDQYAQWDGSGHSVAHKDKIYLAFAELARKEGGDPLYVFCSSCHTPLALATGELPGTSEAQTPTFLTDEGVSCEVCHRTRAVQTVHRGAGANASIILDGGDTRYGGLQDPVTNDFHPSAGSSVHGEGVFCSACHTLTHPFNGVIIENSYEEWQHGPYASAGITCQDCHMRTVDEAIQVAKTMTPIKTPGRATPDSKERPDIHGHMFVGASVSTEAGFGKEHAKAARKRLQSAATIALELPETGHHGKDVELDVLVTNVGAGHAIPSSITELREVWIDLTVMDSADQEVYRSGAILADGSIAPKTVMYHSVLHDKDGALTYLPWRAVTIAREHLIPPKKTVTEHYRFNVPKDSIGPLNITAKLRYRAAPQNVMDELFGKDSFKIETVDMTQTNGLIQLAKSGWRSSFGKSGKDSGHGHTDSTK